MASILFYLSKIEIQNILSHLKSNFIIILMPALTIFTSIFTS